LNIALATAAVAAKHNRVRIISNLGTRILLVHLGVSQVLFGSIGCLSLFSRIPLFCLRRVGERSSAARYRFCARDMAARRSHTASVVGSPDWKSPPKKVNRYALSAVETNADTRQLGSREMPATASCDGLFTGSVTTPSKHGYSRDDLEQLVQLFTPLSVKLPRRTRSCEHVSPNSVKAQQNSSRLPAVDAPVDVVVELSKFPCWLSYSLAEALCRQTDDTQPFMTTKWFTTLAQCVELGHEATLVYLKSTIPAVLWREDIVLAANHPFWLNNHLQPPSVCPVVSVTLSGESGPSLTPFNCQLSLKLERCGRAFREFGWFSFVEVSLPKLPTTQLKSSFVRLVSIGFTLLGQRYTYLFGKCGEWKCWFTRLSPGSVLHWHIPEGPDNVEMSVNQRWSRMNMAFSKAYPTAVATVSCDASDDIRVMQEGDVHSCVGGVALKQYGPAASSCMTDGCGWISHSAMMRVMSRCPSGRDTTLPFAIQGRFGEWKGVWLCQPDHVVACGSKHWIVVRRSMQKWTIPCSVRTRSQSTIEVSFSVGLVAGVSVDVTISCRLQVLKWSHPGSIASLNRQFIAVLAMNGVSTEVLLDMCQCAVNTLTAASSSRSQALQACEFLHGNPLHSDIIRLVHCGLWEEPYTQHRLKSACRTIVESMTAHHHIPVVHSRYALIVPDPTGLLSENEVYFRSSTKLQLCDAETDSRTVIGDVIIARNPCYYPSDMRKVTAVDLLSRIARDDTLASSYEWWRDVCVDVIVCPVAGPCSLASLMSGGDYDGDLAWICWDCRLTSQWKCVEYKCHDCSVAMAASVSSSRDVHMQHLYVNSLQTSTLSMSSNLLLAWMDALFAMADPSSGGNL
jgi:hypothetical protein